ncbi:MAG: UDP-glucose/GDP-mannose dehydrogenase family protein [Candidatus Paceibacterota bacterium]|jgi:UDPglucose 6-dehydrogenase
MFGAGWVGFIQGVIFAKEGCKITFVDVDAVKLNGLREGKCPFFEKGLEPLFKRMLAAGRLDFTTDLRAAVESTDGAFVCVPTPAMEDGDTDLHMVQTVVKGVMKAAGKREYPVVIKSTIPADRFAEIEKMKRGKLSRVDFASNPEFLAEGTAVADCEMPSRIVVGVREQGPALRLLDALYERHRNGGRPYYVCQPEEAILCKQMANVFLPVKISMANEAALICEKLGMDARQVLKMMGADPRIGDKFLHPGPGYGGSCFPKDTKGYAAMAGRLGLTSFLAETAIKTNDRQRKHLVELMEEHNPAKETEFAGKRIAAWGLAFKKDTNDTRESPAIDCIGQMLRMGACINAYDPEVRFYTGFQTDRFKTCATAIEAVRGADYLAILTDWEEFVIQDWEEIHSAMRSPVIFDARSILEPERMAANGFIYYSIGRSTAWPPKRK